MQYYFVMMKKLFHISHTWLGIIIYIIEKKFLNAKKGKFIFQQSDYINETKAYIYSEINARQEVYHCCIKNERTNKLANCVWLQRNQ